MKKLLTLTLVLLLAFSVAGTALAIDQDTPGGAGTTQVTYSVGQSYTVTIPTGPIALDTIGKTGDVSTAAGGVIASGKKLVITATSANPGDSNEFQIADGTTPTPNKLVYAVKKTNDSGDAIVSGGTVFEQTAANLYAGTSNSQTLFFKLTGTPSYAGSYTDTITFTVAISDAA